MLTTRARRRLQERVRLLADEPGDVLEVRRAIVEVLQRTVGFERWCWPVTDPSSCLGTSALGDHDYWPDLPRLLLLEQRVTEIRSLAWLTGAGPEEDVDASAHGLRFGDVFSPRGIGDEARQVLRDPYGTWGCLDVVRDASDRPFADPEKAVLADLAPVLAAVTRRGGIDDLGARHERPPALPPGLLLIDEELRLRGSTAAGRVWLEELSSTQLPVTLTVPPVVCNVAGRVWAARQGFAPHRAATARLRTRSRGWAVVSAEHLDGNAEDTVAVVVGQATPDQLLDLRLSAYGLSPRERHVATLLCRGASTRVLSQQLAISPHTVQDHFKSIFAKVGVRSRSRLVATLTGTETSSTTSDGRVVFEQDGALIS